MLLARLGNLEVVEGMATVVENMVQGEMVQVRAKPTDIDFEHYTAKTFNKTASLMGFYACSQPI